MLSYHYFYSIYDYYFARDFCNDNWRVETADHEDEYSFSSAINSIVEMISQKTNRINVVPGANQRTDCNRQFLMRLFVLGVLDSLPTFSESTQLPRLLALGSRCKYQLAVEKSNCLLPSSVAG